MHEHPEDVAGKRWQNVEMYQSRGSNPQNLRLSGLRLDTYNVLF